jgi:hypothetical protein
VSYGARFAHPNPTPQDNYLAGIAAVDGAKNAWAGHNIWAIGEFDGSCGMRTLIMHYKACTRPAGLMRCGCTGSGTRSPPAAFSHRTGEQRVKFSKAY